MSRRFEGRNVFVTGAGSGFGRRTAELFAAEGAKNLYLIDYKQERLDAVAPVIEASGATPHLLNFDLSVMENCAEAVAHALTIDPKLDVMVSNAAAWTIAEFVDMTDEEWRRVLSVNLDAYFVMGNRAARAMKETGGGVILFTSSIAALGHGRGFTHYCVAKAGVVALTKAIAVECAPYNIRCNSVGPGPADTQQVDIVEEPQRRLPAGAGQPAGFRRRLAHSCTSPPTRRSTCRGSTSLSTGPSDRRECRFANDGWRLGGRRIRGKIGPWTEEVPRISPQADEALRTCHWESTS